MLSQKKPDVEFLVCPLIPAAQDAFCVCVCVFFYFYEEWMVQKNLNGS